MRQSPGWDAASTLDIVGGEGLGGDVIGEAVLVVAAGETAEAVECGAAQASPPSNAQHPSAAPDRGMRDGDLELGIRAA